MNVQTLETSPAFQETWLRDVIPEPSHDLLRLLDGAEENGAALPSDFHTLEDWLTIADYHDEALAAALLLLILAREEGSLCVELSRPNLLRRLEDLLPTEETVCAAWASRILDTVTPGAFPRLIGQSADDYRPVILYEKNGRRFLYCQKFLRHELLFAQAWRQRRDLPPIPLDPERKHAVLTEVLEQRPLRLKNTPLMLDPDQRRAVELGLQQPLLLVSGGPGTGKTSIVVTLLRCLVRLGIPAERIALAAPTGRAAQRLAEALRHGLGSLPPEYLANGWADAALMQIQAQTLHGLLGYVPSRDTYRRHAENPVEADVVVVDEISMVGVVLMSRLFQALRPQTRLILLGDRDQLPSVDAGAVLASIIPAESPPARTSQDEPPQTRAPGQVLVVLHKNHRSEQLLAEASRAARDGDAQLVDRLAPLKWSEWDNAGGCRFLELTAQNPAEIRRIVHHWGDATFLDSGLARSVQDFSLPPRPHNDAAALERLRDLVRLLDQARLLTLVREGPWGCVDLNRSLDRYLRPRLDPGARGPLFAGAPVLVTRNDHARQLFNGDVGLTLHGPGGELRVAFPRGGQFLFLPADALPPHELGFALTVHKSQGSEYDRVLVVLPPEGGRKLLTRELVYTGITRARRLAILCGTRETLGLALQRQTLRESGVLGAGAAPTTA